jgi:hypothetical protein
MVHAVLLAARLAQQGLTSDDSVASGEMADGGRT